jgi:hypothetical protein
LQWVEGAGGDIGGGDRGQRLDRGGAREVNGAGGVADHGSERVCDVANHIVADRDHNEIDRWYGIADTLRHCLESSGGILGVLTCSPENSDNVMPGSVRSDGKRRPGTAGTYNDNPHPAPILFRGIGPQPVKVAAGRACFSPFFFVSTAKRGRRVAAQAANAEGALRAILSDELILKH